MNKFHLEKIILELQESKDTELLEIIAVMKNVSNEFISIYTELDRAL